MNTDKLKTAVLGLNQAGLLLLEAAASSDYFQIEAVADSDTKLAEKIAQQYNCRAYDDYRQLVMQNKFDCLLVAAGLHHCDEYVRAAMKKKINILKSIAPARNFEEAVELVQLAESEKIKFGVVNTTRFTQSFHALRQFLENEQVERISLAVAVCNVGEQTIPAWQNDLELSGGGVLLYNCYEMIDQLVCYFGSGEQVYSLITNAGDRGQKHYLTEDTAIVTIKFSDEFVANIIASRLPATPALTSDGLDQSQRFLKIYGKDRILTVSENRFVITDGLGQIEETLQYDDTGSSSTKKLLENFAQSILTPETNKLFCSAKDNLETMAVIESAYLSARTAMPEQPLKILQMASLQPNIQKSIWEKPQI